MKRAFDLAAALLLFIALLPVMGIVALVVRATSPGPALHWSKRIGRHSRLFLMPKFRTMRIDTPQLPTHLLTDGKSWLTPVGGALRTFSLDELPQLWSVIVGDMSLVGPRPALFSQDDLMEQRRAVGVDTLRPGITGWAQVNGRDELPIPVKVRFEAEYLRHHSFAFDLRILLITVGKVFGRHGVTH